MPQSPEDRDPGPRILTPFPREEVFEESLRRSFASVLEEPVPGKFQVLIEAMRAAEQK